MRPPRCLETSGTIIQWHGVTSRKNGIRTISLVRRASVAFRLFIESSSTSAGLMISSLETAVVGLCRVQRRQKLHYRLYAERGAEPVPVVPQFDKVSPCDSNAVSSWALSNSSKSTLVAGWLAGRCPWLYLAAPTSFGNHCIPLATVLATHLSYTCQNKRDTCTEAARKFPVLIGISTRGCAPFKFDCSQSVNGLIEDRVLLNSRFCYPEVRYWIPCHNP